MPPLTSSLKSKLREKLKRTQERHAAPKILPTPKASLKSKQLDPFSEAKNLKSVQSNEEKKPLTPLQQSMARKLRGAQFRWLNEQLYTLDSKTAQNLIQKHPELYEIYHQGFRDQAKEWPINPLTWILPLLLDAPCSTEIADMGCGDAQIAQTLVPKGYTVHSFDLIAKPPWITEASMTHVPLPSATCDVVIYCLSLMNTDYSKAVNEGTRILKANGKMHIVEVVSRISDLKVFIQSFENAGLKLLKKVTYYV